MDKGEQTNENGDTALRALFIFVAVIAFTLSPVLKYVDVFWSIMAAAVGGIGIQLMIIGRRSWLWLVGSVPMIAGLMWGADLIYDAVQLRALNQQRCLSIEIDMLAPKPTRDNGADIFQALGCDPQPAAAQKHRQLMKAPTASIRPAPSISK